MAYRDMRIECAECGKAFIWRIEEQRALADANQPVVPPQYCPEHRPAAPREPFGRIKWFSAEKGYGFLIEPGGEQLFFHRSGLAAGVAPDLPDGLPVRYEVEYGVKGPQAVNVAPYEENAGAVGRTPQNAGAEDEGDAGGARVINDSEFSEVSAGDEGEAD